MGAGIVAFLGGELKPGFGLVSRAVELEECIRWADLVITGEGKMDIQTGFGKTPAGVADLARLFNKPVIAFTGALCGESDQFRKMGFTALIPITEKPMTLSEALTDAGRLLESAAQRVFETIKLGKTL
jgi:glycerate kinase